MKIHWVAVVLLLGCPFLAGCSSLGIPALEMGKGRYDGEQKVVGVTGPTIDYEVKLTGIEPPRKSLQNDLNEISTAIRLQNKPPPTIASLTRRAEDDLSKFTTVLQSFGFYDGRVTFEIHETSAESEVQVAGPVVLEYRIETGPAYLLTSAELNIIRPDRTLRRPMTDEELKLAGLSLGMQAEAEPIIQAEQKVVDIIRRGGFPLAQVGERRVTANTEDKTLAVTYGVITGKQANFGPIRVTGAERVDPDFIAGFHSWQPGTPFSADELTTTQRELAASNLFESVSVRPAEAVDEQGEIPIDIHVLERVHRTIGGGIDFSTADGIGVNALWENRNLFGAGERLRLHLKGSQLQQGFEVDFGKPQFLRRDQKLVVDGQGKSFNTDAYEGELIDAFAGIERKISKFWSASLGLTAEYSNLTGADSPNEEFYLGGLRGKVRRDSTNNPLDPTTGNRLELTVSPLTSLAGTSSQFISAALNGSQYLPFDKAGHYVLAGRTHLGSVWGEERLSLPANKRYYSGGGGSVRGYKYQMIGPLDENNDPIGGLSVVEAGLEFRARVTDTVGVVPFVEGGNVFESSEPDNLDLQWAAGLGLRYYTAIGPLRLDFAVPLDKRDGIDENYQMYLSIGQAF